MPSPEALKKYDNRVVAFDVVKLARTIMRAVSVSDATLIPEGAQRLSQELALAVGEFLIIDEKLVPSSADVRTMVLKVLKETRLDHVASAYAEHARNAAGLLWRIRVLDVESPRSPLDGDSIGSPWDRRRLLESLRKVGVARDPAGTAAREVERRLVNLSQERVSPALIHSLAALVLTEQRVDVRPYSARRLAFSMSSQVPHYDPSVALKDRLPESSAALEAFWLQAVHSPEVVRAVRENVLSLEPYPCHVGVENDSKQSALELWLDPLLPETNIAKIGQNRIGIRADGPERLAKLAQALSQLAPLGVSAAPGVSGKSGFYYDVMLQASQCWNAERESACSERAPVVTINLAGLLVREVLREPSRALTRIAQLVKTAVKAHREREEYFKLSPVRGRALPVALAGVWNATAWMQGQNVDDSLLTHSSCTLAESLIESVKVALENLRSETGMELILIGQAPHEAIASLWAADREFLLRDGVTLSAEALYDHGPSVVLPSTPIALDLAGRIDFIADISHSFDDPPAAVFHAPLGTESDASAWQELLQQFARTGVQRIALYAGGGSRSMKNITRMLRTHVEGYPLFEV